MRKIVSDSCDKEIRISVSQVFPGEELSLTSHPSTSCIASDSGKNPVLQTVQRVGKMLEVVFSFSLNLEQGSVVQGEIRKFAVFQRNLS